MFYTCTYDWCDSNSLEVSEVIITKWFGFKEEYSFLVDGFWETNNFGKFSDRSSFWDSWVFSERDSCCSLGSEGTGKVSCEFAVPSLYVS